MNAGFKITGSEDAERKDFMYSPFPANKNINPKHWDSKIQFWSNEITRSCRFFEDFCVDCSRLRERFKDNKRSPSGLLVVLASLYESGQLVMKNNVTDISPDLTWTQWGFSIASGTTSWLWKRYISGIHEQTEFVVKELLEEYSIALLDFHYKSVKYEKTDNAVPWNVLKNIYKVNDKTLSDENLTCIIGYLKSIGKCKIGISDSNEKIVKFKAKHQNKVEPITEMDFDVVRLKKSIAKLSMECKSTQAECEKLRENAQRLAKNNDKARAKKVLLKKNKVQKTLEMKHDALLSLKEHLRTVQEAETTKMITDALNSSSTLLGQTYKDQGLSIDHVENVMDKVAEANVMVNELNDVLTDGFKQIENDEFDMDELEKELAELEVDSSVSEEDIVSRLPDVPSESPVKTTPISSNEKKEKKQAVPKQKLAFAM